MIDISKQSVSVYDSFYYTIQENATALIRCSHISRFHVIIIIYIIEYYNQYSDSVDRGNGDLKSSPSAVYFFAQLMCILWVMLGPKPATEGFLSLWSFYLQGVQ